MNTNTADNNTPTTEFAISSTTADMLRLLCDFVKLQERAIALYEGKAEGENVIDATVAVVHSMQDAIAANIGATLTETQYVEM